MTITTEEFVSNFQSLNGTTIGERRKNLFNLLNRTKQAGLTDLNLSSLQPTTPLEEKFKVEVLLYFKRIPELVDVLKTENPILIERVLKASPWFIQGAFRDISSEQLVTLIFPYVSFNVKVKVANKLSAYLNDSQKADQFFEAINNKYGIYLASKLLTSCSPDVITNCIKLNRIKPTSKQLLIIIQKYPHMTESILKLLKKNDIDVTNFYKNIFVYIARHDAVLYSKLSKQYNLSLRLGWRATDKFIQANKQNVITNPAEYYDLLHNKQILKSLKGDFNNFLYNLFPKSLSKLGIWYERIFNLMETGQNLDLLFSTFKKVYGTELWDHPKYVNLKLLEMLPNDERQNRLKIKYKPFQFTEDEWSCYWTVEESIPHLKNRIVLTSEIKPRAKLVRCLVETCRINKDKAALLNVCKLMLAKHRNDHITVRLAFLTALENEYKLENLEEGHWTCVNELIQIFALNQETFYDEDEFLQAYIHFLLRNNQPAKEELTKWLKRHNLWLSILQEAPQYQKQCLLIFGKIIPELFKEEELRRYNLSFLAALIRWNEKYPKYTISPFAFKSPINTLREILADNEYIYEADAVLVYCLKVQSNAQEKSDLLNLYLGKTNKYADIDIMNKLIRCEPLTVVRNIDAVTRCAMKLDRDGRHNWFFWKHCRYYTHLQIPQKIIEICLTTFEGENYEDVSAYGLNEIKVNIITGLSFLMSADEFIKFIIPYYPTELKVDVKDEEAQRKYGLQKGIADSIKNVIPVSQMLESVLHFCKGDFLKLIRRSLYSVSDNTNENRLAPFFNELATRAVSVRKHALHLTLRVMDKAQIYSVIKYFMVAEVIVSIRKFLLQGIFNFFVKNFDDLSWDLVKSNVNALDVHDKEGFDILMQVNKVPAQYMEPYVIFAWSTLSKLPDPDGDIKSKKASLLDSITPDVMQMLSEQFCSAIIQEHLFKDEDHLSVFQAAIHHFTCKYIIYCTSVPEQEERLKSSFAILKNYILSTWHKAETRSEGRNCASNFAKEFCSDFLSNQCRNKEILTKFVNLWNKVLKPHESFDVYLHLQFTLIYTEKLPMPESVQKLASLCESLANIYGSIIVGEFYKKLIYFKNYGCREDSEECAYNFIEELLKYGTSVACSLLVISFLNDNRPDDQEINVRYERIIETLQKKTEPVIHLYLNNHFQS